MVSRAEYARIKAGGGWELQELLLQLSEYKRSWRAKGNDRGRHPKHKSLRASICQRARRRGRKAGLSASIRVSDIHWPERCPVLGIPLDYSTPRGSRKANNPSLPSLDRWDNRDGYVPGNVFVISLRANQIKGNATWQELQAVADYARNAGW